MENKINVAGFAETRREELKDLDAILHEYKHEKTGARVAWIERNEENKTFAIAFKTIPSDDTGVFHILEHSVLNGSKKYPVKEPFVNLLKSSMKTFLNAMTYPDKTMYPVSSRNAKDFHNLMSVYLDAVFFPLAVTDPKIFAQEGWHYEIRSEEDEPSYKGVVFNEMKGAFASVDETIIDGLMRMLYPDTCYKYVSGGDPEKIPSLSYEQFKEAHAYFYHPSNSTTVLDGDLDINDALTQLKEYFDQFDYKEVHTDIPFQTPVSPCHERVLYEIGEQDSEENKVMYAEATLAGTYKDREQGLAWMILSNVLAGNNESPLTKAILDEELGQDVTLECLDDGIQQPILFYIVRNTEEAHVEKIRKVTKETMESLVNGALSHSAIQAAINHAEFIYREKKEPSGVIIAQTVQMSWLYEDNPSMYLKMSECFDDLREKTEQGYFEDLLKKTFLDNELCSLTVVPSKTLGQQRREDEKQRPVKAKESWSEERIKELINFNEELDKWQESEDSEEAAATLPKLTKADIEKDPRPFEASPTEWGPVHVLQYPREDSGIVYWNFYFALNGIRKEQLSEVALFSKMLIDLPTTKHSVRELQELIDGNLGVLSFGTTLFTDYHDSTRTFPVLAASVSMLEHNADKAAEIIKEILTETLFSKEALLPLIQQDVEDYRMAIVDAGHSFAMARAAAHVNGSSAAREVISGMSYGKWLASLLNNEEALQQFIYDTDLFKEILLTQARLTVSITGTESEEAMKSLINSLPKGEFERGAVHFSPLPRENEGILIPSQVSYAALATNLEKQDLHYNGTFRVLAQIATYDWLWNEVRVKGGAYGTGLNVGPTGILGCYSYRDPDMKNALRAFKETAAMLKEREDSEEELESYIIGTLSGSEPLLSPISRIANADARYLSNISYEDRKQLRHDILNTTEYDLKNVADKLEAALRDAQIVLVGNREAIEKTGEEVTILTPIEE